MEKGEEKSIDTAIETVVEVAREKEGVVE